MPLAPGTRFAHYEIAALIGAGGMGEVYRATDTELKRDVALKLLPESLADDADRLARLRREAEVLASMNQHNVAHIYGLAQSGGRTALVMELVDGVTLAERIERGPLPLAQALDVALQVAAGLEAAHERGVVHRDLKPANIKLRPDGLVKVLDFGIAKMLEPRTAVGPHAETAPAMTEVNTVLGTAAYMAPEQARGQPVDRRADIWAFGAVLYEMLTGSAAFLGEDGAATLARVLEREPDLAALPATVPPAVRGTIGLCLHKGLKRRLHDIGDVRLALEGELVELAGPPTTANDAQRWRPTALAAAALAAATLVIGAVSGIVLATRGTPSPLTLPVMRFVVPVPANAPLANLGGYDVVISPDGKRIAYYAQNREAGTVSLYLRELDSLEARVLPGTEVTDTGSGNMNPFFSPDGRSLGFFAADRGVVRLTLDGGPPTKIMDPPEPAFVGAEWAADDTLWFSAGNRLQRVPIAGGNPQTIATAGAGILFASPVLLPGGRAAVFTSIKDGQETIVALDFASREQKVIVRGAGNPTYASSGHLVFARGTTLMAAAFDPEKLNMAGEPVPVLSGVRHTFYGAADYGLSATGTLAYVTASDGAPLAAAVWVDRKGNVSEPSATEPLESPRDPRLSPDGTRLALTTGGPNDGRLWIYDLTGRPPIPLSAGTEDYRSPVWSPDGSRVASTIISQGVDNVFTLRADGSELTPQPLAREKLSGVPGVWSSAGEIFMVRPPYSNGDITVAPAAAAGQVRDVVTTEFAETDPALSPDGRWLAYASNRSGRNEIWVQGYPSGAPARVSRDGGYEPRWSADGRELFYLQANAMMSVAVDTAREFSFSAPVKLFENPYFADASPAISSYDVAKDGRFLMFQPRQAAIGAGGPSAIVVVPNWTEEIKRRVPTQR